MKLVRFGVTRAAVSLILVLMLSLGTAFAYADDQAPAEGAGQSTELVQEQPSQNGDQTGGDDQTENGDQTGGDDQTENGDQTGGDEQTQTEAPAPAPKPVSRIIKKGKYYYYKQANGKIRKKAGFVTDLGKRYYIKKGGKIVTGKTFKVKKKTYRAYRNGVIATGIYKWGGKYYYSDSLGRWIKKEKIVSWKGNKYYLNKKGVVVRNTAFGYNNVPYKADSKGRLKKLEIPDGGGNKVVAVAKKQVGIKTGKKYWRWYFKSRFRNSDATPWCGTFVAWCYHKAGLYKKISGVRRYGNLGYVPSYSRYAKAKGKWVKKSEAKPGDIIVFGKNRHVGIVEGVVDGCIITIEGNTQINQTVRWGRNGFVARRAFKIKDKDIKGIIHPY